MMPHISISTKHRFVTLRRASILALTMWAVMLLSILGLYLGLGVRQKISLVKKLTLRDNLYYIADAGIKKSIMELKRDESFTDTLKENWSNNPAVFQNIRVGLGGASIFYDFIDRDDTKRKMFGMVDEERKININTAKRAVIQRLFSVVFNFNQVQAQQYAASIIDWRDEDSYLSIPLGSAEDSFYRNLENPYDCKDSLFQTLEELLLVKGMNKNLFDQLKGFITIYGEGAVNINTAPPQVLLALGIADTVVDKIISFRQGEDDQQATFDDNVFDAPSSIVADLSQFTSLSSSEVASLSNPVAQGLLTTGSHHFRITSTAELKGSKFTKIISCVVDKEGTFFSWSE